MTDAWDDYYHSIAEVVATKSKDPTKVGAILVAPSGEIILTAYNGPPRGVNDTPSRLERPAKYLYASHAEANLVAFAARNGIKTKGCTVYVTHTPCASCARTLIQAGIKTIHTGDGTTSMPAEEFAAAETMLREAGVQLFNRSERVCRTCFGEGYLHTARYTVGERGETVTSLQTVVCDTCAGRGRVKEGCHHV